MTTRRRRTAKSMSVETLIGEDRDLLKGLMKEALEEILEGEMTQVLGAAREVLSVERLGYRSGYY